jgi:hypothetical protein
LKWQKLKFLLIAATKRGAFFADGLWRKLHTAHGKLARMN